MNAPPAEWPMRIGGVGRPHDALEVLDDRRHGERLDGRRVGVERLDLDLEAGVGGGEDGEATLS